MMPIDFESANVDVEIPEPNSELTWNYYRGFEFKNELGSRCLITMWQPNREEIAAIANGAPIAVLQIGATFNRISLNTSS